MNIIFAGGGTAGHINPALAIASYISKKEPCSISFSGGTGNLEETIVPHFGYEIDTFPIMGLSRGKSPAAIAHNIRAVAQMEAAVRGCKKVIAQRKPDVVIGTGGYAGFPMVRAAQACGVKTAVLEVNAVAGVAVKRLAPRADCVMISYAETAKELKCRRVEETGSPVREELIGCYKRGARTLFPDDKKPVVLSFWGSVGAKYMNEKMKDYLALVAQRGEYDHIHASGKGYFDDMRAALSANGALSAGNVRLCDYIYDMGEAMSQADIVLCRSGGTLAELCAAGMPSVLVPSPFVAENHQERNARVLERAGAAVVICENEASPVRLYETISGLLRSKEKLAQMSKNAVAKGHPDALERICQTVRSL